MINKFSLTISGRKVSTEEILKAIEPLLSEEDHIQIWNEAREELISRKGGSDNDV